MRANDWNLRLNLKTVCNNYINLRQEGLNAEINGAQDRIFKLNQENTETRLKIQSIDNDVSIHLYSILSWKEKSED